LLAALISLNVCGANNVQIEINDQLEFFCIRKSKYDI
jgi:hypothetical protein